MSDHRDRPCRTLCRALENKVWDKVPTKLTSQENSYANGKSLEPQNHCSSETQIHWGSSKADMMRLYNVPEGSKKLDECRDANKYPSEVGLPRGKSKSRS